MATLDQLRALFPDAESDADLIRRASKDFGIDPAEISSEVGYKVPKGGLTSQQLSSSIDRYQAGLYGVGEEIAKGVGLTGTSKYLRGNRQENELQADIASNRARELGAVDEFKNVHGIGDFGSYAKGLAIQSVPYAAEALVGGLAARGAMTGTRAALTAAETAGDVAAVAKAKKALDIGSTAGGTAASYPSSVGDVLSNQREQSPTGETRGGVAAALGIPYAALNAVGVESALMRGNLFKNSINLLDKGTGLTGAAARTAATATGVGLKEGASETGQEMINQLGRMAVDKNEQFFSDAAQERFKESFIGGAVLGGVAGGSLGGWRRSGNDVSQAISSGDQTNPPITTQQFTPPPAPPALSAGVMSGLTGRGADPLAGRSKLIGGEPAPAPTPPAVAGGSTDIAQAQQQAQIESQQIQKAQAQQAAREQIYTNFGIADPTNPTKGNLFGKPLFGPSVPAVADALGAATRTMSAYQLEVAQAINKANADTGGKLLNFQFNANDPTKSVQKAIEAVGKVANAFQISHVQTVEEAAQILNEQSNTLKGTKLEQLNAIHQALTGEDTSGYLAEQQPKATKGAKNVQQPKLQTTTGLGTVPVQGGTREGGGGDLGNVQPSGLQSLLSGSQPQGQTSQQIGQPSGEGIRTGTSVTPDLSDDKSKALEEINGLLQQVFGGTRPEGAFDETENTAEAGASGGATGQSGQAKEPSVVTTTSEGNGGPRQYEIPAQYYNTDIMHIRPQRRQEVINEVLSGALTPEVDRENTVSQEDRVAIVRMSLLEDMTAPDIALELGLKTDTVDQQRRRLGIRLGTYGLEINQSLEEGREFMASLMLSAENFRSPEFPDGIGAKEFAGLYSAKDLYYDKGKFQHMGKPVEEEQEEGEQPAVTTDVKLQEELKNKPESEAATQSAGQIKTAGGSQGNIDSLKKSRKDKKTGQQVLDIGALDQITNLEAEADRIRDALDDMAPKDPRRDALANRLDTIGDVDSGELGALWEQYAKAQTIRDKAAKTQGVTVDKEKEEAAEAAAPTELTGEEIAASEREDERRKEATEKAKADQGEEDAIQEQGADEGDVRQPAGGGEEVGKTNAKPKKPAKQTKQAKTEVAPEEGKVGPHEYRGTDRNMAMLHYTEMMKAGNKPAAVVPVGDIQEGTLQMAADIYGWPTKKINTKMVGPVLVVGVNQQAFDRTVSALAQMDKKGETQSTATELGRSLGYSNADIEAWHKYQSEWEKPLYPVTTTNETIKTPEEQWKVLADQFPGMPPYEGLTKDEKIRWDDVASRGVANLAAANTVLTTTVKAGTAQAPSATGTSEEIEGKFGKDGAVTESYSVAELTKEISDFVRTAINTRRLKIVGSVKDLLMSADPVEQKLGAVLALNRAYGVATNGRAYLIADRIGKGQGRAKFMHEVGVHLGVEGLLPDKQFDKLTDQIFTWAKRDDDSREAKLAKKAILRAETAGTPDEDLRSEILAYFVEEAMQNGINPSAAEKLSGSLGSWFRTLWAAFKTAIRRLGMNPEKMDAQDVVNLTYGAARLEMSGTYHGTAADFRRFNHMYMGSGEGAQAYGWGTYLAQRFGIAKGYWKADVRRKVDVDPNKGNPLTRFLGLSPLAKPEGNVMRVDIGVDQSELLNWDGKLSKQPELLAKLETNIPEALKQSLRDETNLDLNEMTGEDLYRGLEFLEKKEGRVSEEFNVDDYNKRLANKKAKELVSVYLDEVVGIPGLKFYDAESRNAPENEIVFKGKQYKREDLINMRGENAPIRLNDIVILRHVLRNGYDETLKELERKFDRNVQLSLDVRKETYAKYNTPYDEAKSREEITERYQKTYEGEQIKFLKDNKDNISVVKGQGVRTRNLVIFNDKNIFRVGSRGGNERANMKFGSTEQKPPRLEKRENGRVIDLIVDGQTAESFELASKGLWDRFGGDEEKILRGNDAQTAKEKAYKALRSAEYAYRQEGPLNRVEQITLDDLERGDLEGLRARMSLLFDGGQLRYNIGKLISHAVYNPDTPLDANAPEAKYAPKWVLGQEARPAQPTEEISIGTRRAPTRRDNMKFGIDAVLPAAATKPAKSVVTNIATAARNGLLSAGITEDVVSMASKYMRSAKDYLDAQYARQKTRLEFEMRIERILENFDKLPKNLQGTGAGSVNRYILDSTMQRKWGYYPGEERIGTQLFETDPDLAARFNAFPDNAQQLIKDVFEHGYTALDMKKTAVSKAVEREFAERERAAIGDVDALADLQKERKAMVAKLSRLQNIDFTVPYAYLGRYGDYIVVAKSKEFKHWQERAQLNDFDVKQAKAWLSDNSSNPDHYVVQFAETQGEADQLAAELIATGKFDMDGTEAGPKEAAASYIGDDLHLAVSRARNLANRQKGEGSEELDKLLGDLYLLTAAENSARKSEIARKYVYGANENMMRNLATSGRADAHFLSTMEHNDAITESLEKMRDEARRNYKEAMPLYNELYTRQANSMDYKQPALLSQALTQATSLWFLSTSPAFYLQQILQTGVLSLPYMAGRLGYFRSARAIKTAYGDVAGLVKGLGVSEHVDFSKAPADVRGMLETLVGMGKIDIGIDSDARSRAGEQGTLGKVVRKLQGVNNRIETINRATAAIAAYRGYLQRFGANNTDAATKFAAEVVSNSHGSYDGFNTPRVLNSDVGRVVGQFKRFQIIQLSMLAKLIHTSFKGASAEEKMVARRALAFITGHMAVLGGALGVPFVMQIGNLLTNLFGDDDEPKDFEYKLRQAIGDKALADLLLNGVPAAMGVNLGGKLGMGNVASILPFTDVDLSSRSGYEKVMVGMMGPFFGGLAPKFIDGAGMITKGEYYKGLELMMPNGIGNAMKGVRFATEGITMRNGDVVMKPEDISIVDAAFQAVGLPTTTITGRQYTQKTKVEFDKFYADKAAEIKSAYVDANRDGDSAGMSDARKDWENLQESRRRNKYKIQPMSELFMAVSAASKRQRSVVNGVETSKSNKQFVANII